MQRAQHFGNRRQQFGGRHLAVAGACDRRKGAFFAVRLRDIEADRRRQDLRDGFIRYTRRLAFLDQFARGTQQFRRSGIDPAIEIVPAVAFRR
jgi:hypothetical protein